MSETRSAKSGREAGGMRLLLIAAFLPMLAGCSDACRNTLVSRTDAPDGKHSAVLFQRDCGATTRSSTQMSIVAPGEEPSNAGNAFRADDDHGAASAGPWGGPWVEVNWLAADRLLVSYAARSRIFKQADHVDGVHVTYRAVAR